MSGAVTAAKRFVDRPGVAHLLRANTRFTSRLGTQFSAAVTYFSVLAIVPIVLFAFSVVGFVLTVVNPGALGFVLSQLSGALQPFGASASRRVLALVENALRHWAAPGIIGLLSAMYSGAGWAGNLRDAVRAQWTENFDVQFRQQQNIVVKTLKNFGVLIGLLVSLVITFALASISTALTDTVLDLVGLSDISWLKPVLVVVPIVISIAAGWLVFLYLFLVLPEERAPWPALRRGCLIGAVGLGVLQYGTTLLIQALSGNKAVQLFGPVVVVMLFFNLFARLVLFCAAWIVTWEEPAIEPRTSAEPGAIPPENRTRRTAAQSYVRGEPTPDPELDEPLDPDAPRNIRTPGTPVPEKVALRASRLSLGAGWITGTATGAGLGALLALGLSRLTRGRKN